MSRSTATALREVLEAHRAPTSPADLHRFLARKGVTVHRHTLAQLLAGETRPRRSTLQKILNALDATEPDRRAVHLANEQSLQRPPSTISVLDAIGGVEAVDRGRERETVIWRYRIGDTDDADEVLEIRRTVSGPDGLQVASFGPGQLGSAAFPIHDLTQLGSAAFPIHDLTQLGLRISAKRHLGPTSTEPVPVAPLVVDLRPGRRQYRAVAQFSGVGPNETIEWHCYYRWPGLWRSLRNHGRSDGNLSMNTDDRPTVTSASLNLIADNETFPDLQLDRLIADGRAERFVDPENRLWLTWTRDGKPDALRFRVSSQSRRSGW